MVKNHRIEFRLSIEQKKIIDEKASRVGLKVSEYILFKVFQDDLVFKADKRFARELKRVGL